MRILVFGDSIAQGFWDIEGGWVQRLRKHYDQFTITGKDEDAPTIFNLGVSGDSSDDVLARLNSETKARNRYGELSIIFAIGFNDSRTKAGKNFSDTNRYAKNLEELVKIARSFTNKILFVGLTPCAEERSNPVAWENTGYTNKRIWAFETALRTFCNDNDLPYVKVFEVFTERQLQTELLPDGIHPNEAGHQLIADLVLPQLDALIANKPILEN